METRSWIAHEDPRRKDVFVASYVRGWLRNVKWNCTRSTALRQASVASQGRNLGKLLGSSAEFTGGLRRPRSRASTHASTLANAQGSAVPRGVAALLTSARRRAVARVRDIWDHAIGDHRRDALLLPPNHRGNSQSPRIRPTFATARTTRRRSRQPIAARCTSRPGTTTSRSVRARLFSAGPFPAGKRSNGS